MVLLLTCGTVNSLCCLYSVRSSLHLDEVTLEQYVTLLISVQHVLSWGYVYSILRIVDLQLIILCKPCTYQHRTTKPKCHSICTVCHTLHHTDLQLTSMVVLFPEDRFWLSCFLKAVHYSSNRNKTLNFRYINGYTFLILKLKSFPLTAMRFHPTRFTTSTGLLNFVKLMTVMQTVLGDNNICYGRSLSRPQCIPACITYVALYQCSNVNSWSFKFVQTGKMLCITLIL